MDTVQPIEEGRVTSSDILFSQKQNIFNLKIYKNREKQHFITGAETKLKVLFSK